MAKQPEKRNTSPFDLSDPEVRELLGLNGSNGTKELAQAALGMERDTDLPKAFTIPALLMNGKAVEYLMGNSGAELLLPTDLFTRLSQQSFRVNDDGNEYLILALDHQDPPSFLQLQKKAHQSSAAEYRGRLISEDSVRKNNRKAVRLSAVIKAYKPKG